MFCFLLFARLQEPAEIVKSARCPGNLDMYTYMYTCHITLPAMYLRVIRKCRTSVLCCEKFTIQGLGV